MPFCNQRRKISKKFLPLKTPCLSGFSAVFVFWAKNFFKKDLPKRPTQFGTSEGTKAWYTPFPSGNKQLKVGTSKSFLPNSQKIRQLVSEGNKWITPLVCLIFTPYPAGYSLRGIKTFNEPWQLNDRLNEICFSAKYRHDMSVPRKTKRCGEIPGQELHSGRTAKRDKAASLYAVSYIAVQTVRLNFLKRR